MKRIAALLICLCCFVYASNGGFALADQGIQLTNDGWVDGDAISTKVYGDYQRDLRYFSLDEFPILYDVMSAVSGYWAGVGGGEIFFDSLMLYADGTYVGWMGYAAMEDEYDVTKGYWYITAYDPSRNACWDNPPYTVTFAEEDGSEHAFGLTVSGDSLSLTVNEGGEGYERRDPPVDDPHYEPDEFRHG